MRAVPRLVTVKAGCAEPRRWLGSIGGAPEKYFSKRIPMAGAKMASPWPRVELGASLA